MPGFGGNGDGVTASTAGTTCINDGNFASKHVAFDYKPGFGIQPNDHCLARDFAQKDPEGRVAGAKVKPSVVQEILNQPDYESFSDKIQTGPGNIISEWVGGDFAQYTAPNDPLFILHLVNLDRLWWYWQHLEPLTRYNEYAGRRRHDFEYRATLNDTISLGTRLAPDVKVSDAMWGQSELMCYTYYL